MVDKEQLEKDTNFGVAEETEVPEDIVGGNGQNPSISEAEADAFEERELDREIPGRGHLFHVKRKHLHESTRLNKKMIWAFAIGDVQQSLFELKRKDSVFDKLKFGVMGYEISEDGKGRDESIILHRLTAEEKQSSSDGGLLDRR
ncbi:hypothetical protein MUP46_00985 [Patescibacteria group bacterium]|nr:hypothetical protein [Patescibacteria group bacterium]